MTGRQRFGWLGLCAALGVSQSAQGQEVGIHLSGGRSGNPEHHQPIGLRVSAAVFPVSVVGLRFTYGRDWTSNERPGSTCDSYWPGYENCREEQLLSNGHSQRSALGLLVRTPAYRGWRLQAGLEKTRMRVKSLRIRGEETGRRYPAYVPSYENNEDDVLDIVRPNGTALSVTLIRTSLLGPFLDGQIGYEDHSVEMDGCVTDSYVPFCRKLRVQELHLGIVYRLNR